MPKHIGNEKVWFSDKLFSLRRLYVFLVPNKLQSTPKKEAPVETEAVINAYEKTILQIKHTYILPELIILRL